MLKKLGGLFLVVVLVVAFLPNVNAAPMLIDIDPIPDSLGPPNSELELFEGDDDSSTLYFHVYVPFATWDSASLYHIVDFENTVDGYFYRIYMQYWWFPTTGGMILSDVERSTDGGATYLPMGYTLGNQYNIILTPPPPPNPPFIITFTLQKSACGLGGDSGGSLLTNVYATTLDADISPVPLFPAPTPPVPIAFDQTNLGGTYTTQVAIPEFSTLLIPVIGTIALFAVFRKYKKK